MIRSRLIVLAMAAAFAGATGSEALAEHGGRPLNVPPKGSANLNFLDGDGSIRGFESGGPGAVGIFIYGWSFDGNNPNSPFVASSPVDTRTKETLLPDPWRYAYNETTFAYDQINVEAFDKNPSALGPGRIAMFDDSILKVTNSILRTDVIGAGDRSTVQVSNTRLAGELRMRSTGSMTLSAVTPFQTPFEAPNLRLIAESGTTEILSSTLLSVTSRGRASVTVTSSTIRDRVSHDRGALDPSLVPTTTLGDTNVGSLSALIGTIRMTGGRVDGAVQASGDADDPLRAGGIFIDKAPVGGSVSASKHGTVTILGSSVRGNVTAGDATNAIGNVRILTSDVLGSAQAVGSGIVEIHDFQGIGTSGTAVRASGRGSVNVANGARIFGDVFAVGESSVVVSNVTKIGGNAFADESATLSLTGTSVRNVGAFANSTLNLGLTSADSVLVDRGTANLEAATIADRIDVFGKGRLSFGGGSTVGGSITNFGDSTGLVQINSGSVGGDLVGSGSSITAMSGGHVNGSPIFGEQATFLYSGGTFGFATIVAPARPNVASRQSDIDIAASAALLPTSSGFTALGDATIQFIGFDLQSTLLDPDYVQDDVSYSVYRLAGRLADNSSIDGGLVYIQNAAGTASFALVEAPPVPEPSVTALFLIGVSCLGVSRRARRALQSHRFVRDCGRKRGLIKQRSPGCCDAVPG